MKHVHKTTTLPPQPSELRDTIEQIGIARFVSRINSGVIPNEAGYAALERFVEDAKRRPLISRLTSVMLGNKDTYTR